MIDERKTYDFFQRTSKYFPGLLRWIKFLHSPIVLLNKSVFPKAMHCFCHCALCSRTECIMQYGAVQKCYHSSVNNSRFCLFKIKLFGFRSFAFGLGLSSHRPPWRKVYWVKFLHRPILHYAFSSWIEKTMTKTMHCHWENRFV